MPFSARTLLFPTRSEFAEYLGSYADKFQLPMRTGVEATGLRRENASWTVETASDLFRSRSVVVATGIMSSPVGPNFKGLSSYTGTCSPQHRLQAARRTSGAGCIGGRGWKLRRGNRFGARQRRVGTSGVGAVGSQCHPEKHCGHPIPILRMVHVVAPETDATPHRARRRSGRQPTGAPAGLPRKRGFNKCMDVPVIGNSILDHIDAGRVRILSGVAEFNERSVRLRDGTGWAVTQ